MPFAALLFGVVALAYLAPWPVLVQAWTWAVNDPTVYAFPLDTGEWAHRSLFLALFLVVAGILWATDRWLSGIVGLAGVQTFALGPRAVTAYLLIGVGVIVGARLMPRVWRERAYLVLGITGAAQALMVLAQWGKGLPAVGSLGVSGLAAGYVAMTGLLLPSWMLPLIGGAVLATESRVGIVAFALGLLVRVATAWPAAVMPTLVTVLVVALALAGSVWLSRDARAVAQALVWRASLSGDARVTVITDALRDQARSARALVTGFGLGSFSQRKASAPGEVYFGERRIYVSAHSEPVQWLYEMGLLGMIALGGWLVRWRSLFVIGRHAPALVSIAILALAWSPFHDLRTGILAALLVGVGSPLTEGA